MKTPDYALFTYLKHALFLTMQPEIGSVLTARCPCPARQKILHPPSFLHSDGKYRSSQFLNTQRCLIVTLPISPRRPMVPLSLLRDRWNGPRRKKGNKKFLVNFATRKGKTEKRGGKSKGLSFPTQRKSKPAPRTTPSLTLSSPGESANRCLLLC